MIYNFANNYNFVTIRNQLVFLTSKININKNVDSKITSHNKINISINKIYSHNASLVGLKPFYRKKIISTFKNILKNCNGNTISIETIYNVCKIHYTENIYRILIASTSHVVLILMAYIKATNPHLAL